MADRQISSLPQAQTVDDDSLFVLEQQGVAMKASGAQWKGYAQDAVRQYVTQAQQQAQAAASSATQAANSATAAAASASDAEEAVTQIGTAVDDTLANVQAAQAAQEAAEAAQEAAETAADGVEAFVTEAESARDAAIVAQQAAETAEWNAETSATGAATSASQASQSASDASGSATDAAGSATTATQAASDAQAAQLLAETAKTGAEAAEDGAEAARDAILNMIVKAITLETGQPATVSKELVNGIFQLTFGLPKGNTGKTGAQGIQGVSIESIQLTSGNHAPGTTDTYTITLSNDTTYTFSVYNGANGTGTGDFMASGIVPMTGNLQMGGNRVTGMAAPTADTDGATKGYVDKGLSNKQDTLSGTEDQLVGFNSAGEATAVSKPTYTAADVGAMPAVSGGSAGQVLTKTEAGQEWQDAPDGLPEGGQEGQVLTKGGGDTVTWSDPASGLPDGGTPGQMLYQGESGPEWGDKPIFWVLFETVENGTYEANKSFEEIEQAFLNKNVVLGINYSMRIFALCEVSSSSASFVNIEKSITTVGFRIIEINSNDTIDEYYFSIELPSQDTIGNVLCCMNDFRAEWVSLNGLPATYIEFRPGNTGLTSDNVQDAIEEVNNKIPTNYVPTTRTINSKPLSSNVTLTAEDVGAIANPNSGTTGQILTKTENGVKWADPPSGGTASYVASFTAEQWTAGTGESTITIPAATHKLSGSIVDCKAFASISGGYRAGVWASLETYATVAENGDIVLHYPDTSGYAGAAVLTAYEIPS